MDNFNEPQIVFCQYCGRECKSLNSLKQHERRCKNNPNRLIVDFSKRTPEKSTRKGINKGNTWVNNGIDNKFIKSFEIENYLNLGWKLGLSDTYKQKISNSLIGVSTGKASNEEAEQLRKIRISNSMKHNPNCGGYREKSGRGKKGKYKGIYCDSSWELAFVVYHLDNELKISRCNEQRKYIFNNVEHIYIPDFITDNGIIEIKGYKSEQWNEKHKQNPDIKVLYYEDMKEYLDYVENKYGTNWIDYLYNIK